MSATMAGSKQKSAKLPVAFVIRMRDASNIMWHEEKTLWKIDYYDPEYRYWYDPLSPECHRVLTIMLASEY